MEEKRRPDGGKPNFKLRSLYLLLVRPEGWGVGLVGTQSLSGFRDECGFPYFFLKLNADSAFHGLRIHFSNLSK
jgi:hypothetical protein